MESLKQKWSLEILVGQRISTQGVVTMVSALAFTKWSWVRFSAFFQST